MKTIHIVYIVCFSALSLWLSSVNAQGVSLLKPSNVAGPYSTYFPAGQTGFAITSASTVGTSSGVSLTTSGIATAIKNGSHISIPVSLTTSITKANVAVAAGRAFKVARGLAGPIGLALTAYEIYNVVKDSGLSACPAPDYICKSSSDFIVAAASGQFVTVSGDYAYGSSPASVCAMYKAPRVFKPVIYDSAVYCVEQGSNNTYVPKVRPIDVVCPSGSSLTLMGCANSTGSGPATDADIETKLADSFASSTTGAAATKRAWDAAEAVNQVARASGKSAVPTEVMIPPTAQTIMVAPPVVTPQATTSVQQYKDAAGVPQTQTSQESTTITPVKSGNGTSTNVTYDVRNVTTTTVTNNTSGSTSNPSSVTTTTANSHLDMPPSSAATTDLPTDYNREVTQQAIAADIAAMRNVCQDNPRRAGCAEFDVPPVADAIPRKEVPITYTPTIFASSATCPAPIGFDMYGARQISFTPMCDLMTKLRPLFLACAAAGAALIFMRGLKS